MYVCMYIYIYIYIYICISKEPGWLEVWGGIPRPLGGFIEPTVLSTVHFEYCPFYRLEYCQNQQFLELSIPMA